MKYAVRFGIKEWNDRLDFSHKTVKEVCDDLEDFFYTYGIRYKYIGNYFYEFVLPHEGKRTHLAKIGYIE